MAACDAALDQLDWADIDRQLDAEGHAVLPSLLGVDGARALARAAVSAGPGWDERLHFDAGLPAGLAPWRAALYRRLVRVANRWNATLGLAERYPPALDACLGDRHAGAAPQALSYLSRLGPGEHAALQASQPGAWAFPLQIVALLSEPRVDFDGGELVLTEQRPRMQSRVTVVPLGLGDMVVIAKAERPFTGAGGYYRVKLRHGVGRVRAGERIGLELFFHDAP